jgi:hypothetical protein
MNALKNLLTPLTGNGGPIHDTLVGGIMAGTFTPFKYISCIVYTETGGYRWNDGNCTTGLHVSVEWVCRLQVFCLFTAQSFLFYDSSYSAFFLTAHFSQEDYPYDWCVPGLRNHRPFLTVL